jgi:hypothetical protein
MKAIPSSDQTAQRPAMEPREMAHPLVRTPELSLASSAIRAVVGGAKKAPSAVSKSQPRRSKRPPATPSADVHSPARPRKATPPSPVPPEIRLDHRQLSLSLDDVP